MSRKKSLFFTREKKSRISVYFLRDLGMTLRDLGIWNSSWGYWLLVQGLKWPFYTFTLVFVTHLTELFNVRD